MMGVRDAEPDPSEPPAHLSSAARTPAEQEETARRLRPHARASQLRLDDASKRPQGLTPVNPSRKQKPVRWQFGIRSRNSPWEALLCIYKALSKLGCGWLVDEDYEKFHGIGNDNGDRCAWSFLSLIASTLRPWFPPFWSQSNCLALALSSLWSCLPQHPSLGPQNCPGDSAVRLTEDAHSGHGRSSFGRPGSADKDPTKYYQLPADPWHIQLAGLLRVRPPGSSLV